jgi:hypothetical protein
MSKKLLEFIKTQTCATALDVSMSYQISLPLANELLLVSLNKN